MDLVNNSLRRLHSLVAKMKYTGEFDADRMRIGDSYSLLPICNYGLLHFSSNLALEISNLGLEVYGTSDSKFVECLYRVMRDIFNYQPKIKQTQFLSSTGFAEKKISLVADVMQAINEKYPMKPKSKIVAASRVFPPNRSAPPNMGRVERNIPLEVKENGNGVKDLAAMCHQSNMRPAAVKVTEIVDEKTIAANGEQLASSAFRQVGVPQPMVQNHVTRADDFSSTNRFAHMLANGHDLETRDVRSQLEEQSNQLKEAMKSASEKEVVIVEKLDQVCSMLERLSSRQDRLESKVDELLNKPNSESSASRTLDNLSARTSLLETKIEMIESENSRIYRQSPVASITRNSHSSIIDQQRLVNGNNTKHLDGLSITELNDSNSSIKSSNAKSREAMSRPRDLPSPRPQQLENSERSLRPAGTETYRVSAETEQNFNLNRSNISVSNVLNGLNASEIVSTTAAPDDYSRGNMGGERGTDVSTFNDRRHESVIVSSPLTEQKARIEALFHETSSALRFPLTTSTDKENVSNGHIEITEEDGNFAT